MTMMLRPLLRRRRPLLLMLVCAVVYLFFRDGAFPPSPPRAPPPLPVHESTIAEATAHFGHVRGISIFQPDNLIKHVVLPQTLADDTSWLVTLPPWLNMTPIVYHIPPSRGAFNAPMNRGNEAMAYLSYIIDRYDALPDVVAFVHSSATAWHNNQLHEGSTPMMLRELNYARVRRLGYVNLRCHWDPGCPGWVLPNGLNDPVREEQGHFAAAFEALLIPVLLKPVVDKLGPLGATFGDAVARAVLAQSPEPRER